MSRPPIRSRLFLVLALMATCRGPGAEIPDSGAFWPPALDGDAGGASVDAGVSIEDGGIDAVLLSDGDAGLDASAFVDDDAGISADASADDAGMDAGPPPPPLSLSVLFIGNSHTAGNDVPGLVRSLAQSSTFAQIGVDSVTIGGASLSDHYYSGVSVPKIQQGGWTHVVLQPQSVEACANPPYFHGGASKLIVEVKDAGANPVLFETWARGPGDEIYVSGTLGRTPAEVQACLAASFNAEAADSGAQVARIGDAWMIALSETPDYALWSSDWNHATMAGSYLAACVLFGTLTNRTPVGLSFRPAALSFADATWLQLVAARVLP